MVYTEHHTRPVLSAHKRRNQASSVWAIMQSCVNDNIPGYSYWFGRILVASILGLCVIRIIEQVL